MYLYLSIENLAHHKTGKLMREAHYIKANLHCLTCNQPSKLNSILSVLYRMPHP